MAQSTKLLNAQELESACISSANRLMAMCKLDHPPVSSVKDISSNIIVAVFEKISGISLPAVPHAVDKSAQIQLLQSVIDHLSSDLLGLPLSHISAENVVTGNSVDVLNLVEILEAVYLHLSSQENNDPVNKDECKTSSSVPPHRKVFKRTVTKNKVQRLKSHRKESKKISFLTSDDDGIEKDVRRSVKSLRNTNDINDLQNFNFETRVKSLLLGEHSPQIRCQQLRKTYLKSKKPSYKDFPVCNKSYLLPYNLRKHSYQQRPIASKKKKDTAENVNIYESENAAMPSHSLKGFLQEFPELQFSSSAENFMIRDYHRHLSSLHKQVKGALLRIPETVKQEQIAKRKQAVLSEILAKDVKQRHVLRKVKEERALENKIRFKLRDAQLRSARIKLYFDRYHSAMQKKLQQPNTEEELLVQKAFQRMLQRQKEEVRSLCKLLKEADKKDAQQHLQYLEALENTYQNQFALLAGVIKAEQTRISDQAKENEKVTLKRQQKWRTAVQEDIRSLQENTLSIIKDTHFRQLDANKFS